MASWEDVERLGLELPEVTSGTWYSTPGLHVRKKGFCRLWGDREHAKNSVDDTAVLVVMCDVEEKPALIDSSDGVLFTTPHYAGSGSMLIRLADVALDDLAGHLEDSWCQKAPKSLLKQLRSE